MGLGYKQRSPSMLHVFFRPPSHWSDHKTASWAGLGNPQNVRQVSNNGLKGMEQLHSQGGVFKSSFKRFGSTPFEAYTDWSSKSSKPRSDCRWMSFKSTWDVLGCVDSDSSEDPDPDLSFEQDWMQLKLTSYYCDSNLPLVFAMPRYCELSSDWATLESELVDASYRHKLALGRTTSSCAWSYRPRTPMGLHSWCVCQLYHTGIGWLIIGLAALLRMNCIKYWQHGVQRL